MKGEDDETSKYWLGGRFVSDLYVQAELHEFNLDSYIKNHESHVRAFIYD
jgi:hypothetical protein